MIDINTIDREILDLEKKEASYAVIERLAWLYIVRDHMIQPKQTGLFMGSEFCECCSNVPMESLMQILSEHMEQIQVLFPKEYENLIARIKGISSSI